MVLSPPLLWEQCFHNIDPGSFLLNLATTAGHAGVTAAGFSRGWVQFLQERLNCGPSPFNNSNLLGLGLVVPDLYFLECFC